MPLMAAPQSTAVQTEIQKIDGMATDTDTRLAVVSAMADALKVHRNHLILLRKETGQTFGQIFVQSLEKDGMDEDAILKRTRALETDIGQRIELARTGGGESGAPRTRPVLSLNTGVDHNSAGTFLWVNPEIGIDSKRASFVAGVPYYRTSASGTSLAGVGDVYATGSLYGRAARMDFESSLTLGLPTGDKNLGLGAGKTTVDVSGTIAHRFERVRPFVSAGFANSIFNFAYQRPYIADGNAAHFSGGFDLRAAPRLTFGAGGFGVMPTGTQVVYSRIAMGQASAPAQGSGAGTGTPSGSMGGNGMGGTGSGMSGPTTPQNMSQMPASVLAHMPFLATTGAAVPASELEDYGANAWASVTVARGVTLNFAAARSVPFQLTTVRVSLGLDLARLLFPSKHF